MFWKKKVCNQKTQTISRTQSKPNLLEGHKVFWGFVPLFFTYTVLGPARAEWGFELHVAKYHKGGKRPSPLPWIYFQPNRELGALESWGQPAAPAATSSEPLHSVIPQALGGWPGACFLCYPHGNTCRKGSQQPFGSGDPTRGLLRKEGCQKWDKWTDLSREYLLFSKANVECNHRADLCPLLLWKRIPQGSVHSVVTDSLLAKITAWKIKCDGFI